jgi:hypothetical protein
MRTANSGIDRFFFVTVWRLDAPLARVWETIHASERSPEWWPNGVVQSIQIQKPVASTTKAIVGLLQQSAQRRVRHGLSGTATVPQDRSSPGRPLKRTR